MKRRAAYTVIAALSLAFIATAEEAKNAGVAAVGRPQTHCPVMERYEVDKSQFIDVKGWRIYVCCKGCINQIKANPDKYIKRLEDKGIVLEKAPEPTNGKNTK